MQDLRSQLPMQERTRRDLLLVSPTQGRGRAHVPHRAGFAGGATALPGGAQ